MKPRRPWPRILTSSLAAAGLLAGLGLSSYFLLPGILPPVLFDPGNPGFPDIGIEVLPRKKWRAQAPTGRFDSLGAMGRITIHHQGGNPFEKDDLAATGDEIRSIQKDHQKTRGWADIGYHLIIDRAGRVWEGRPITALGAHAGNSEANAGNIGIVVLGNYDLQTVAPAQEAALLELISKLCEHWKIPRGEVRTHNEVRTEAGEGKTNCPGMHLAELVKKLRN